MVGVNGKVLLGCFIYVGGAEVPRYLVETVRRVELGRRQSQQTLQS